MTLFGNFYGIREAACAIWLFLLVFFFDVFVKDMHLYMCVIKIS